MGKEIKKGARISFRPLGQIDIAIGFVLNFFCSRFDPNDTGFALVAFGDQSFWVPGHRIVRVF